MPWERVIFWLAIVTSCLAFAAVVGRATVYWGATRAASGSGVAAWKLACFASQLLWWAGFAAILEWLVVVAARTQILADGVGAFFASGILLAVPVSIALARGQRFWDIYWETLKDSLEAADLNETQRQTFNEQHDFLLEGSARDRNAILAKILKEEGPDRIEMAGSQPRSVAAAEPEAAVAPEAEQKRDVTK